MEFLYDIPIIGLVIQFVVYVIVQLPVLAPTDHGRRRAHRRWVRCAGS